MTVRKHIETYRETITPDTQEQVPDILTALLPIARAARASGKLVVNLHEGGVRSIDVDHTQERVEK